jgi:hypothetical protein
MIPEGRLHHSLQPIDLTGQADRRPGMTERDSGRGIDRALQRTLFFLAVGSGALIVALVFRVGNKTLGLALIYGGVGALVLAVVHRWRHVKPFLLLTLAALIGMPFFVLMHNLLYAVAELAGGLGLVRRSAEALHVASFLAAIFVCPATLVVGSAGALVTWIRNRGTGS